MIKNGPKLYRYTTLWRFGATQILALVFFCSRANQYKLILNFCLPLIESRSKSNLITKQKSTSQELNWIQKINCVIEIRKLDFFPLTRSQDLFKNLKYKIYKLNLRLGFFVELKFQAYKMIALSTMISNIAVVLKMFQI